MDFLDSLVVSNLVVMDLARKRYLEVWQGNDSLRFKPCCNGFSSEAPIITSPNKLAGQVSNLVVMDLARKRFSLLKHPKKKILFQTLL